MDKLINSKAIENSINRKTNEIEIKEFINKNKKLDNYLKKLGFKLCITKNHECRVVGKDVDLSLELFLAITLQQ
ncbi:MULTISPECIES: hypothetical protein [Clostridium]|uniref:hypothetical protein n=1 Tax=Clostridium TaxID=1485 RepID=UPI000825F9B2|nr:MULTISPECIES: hypothetical protein [Clostridium]PJI08322.1 hypothetical protein CUB90_10795 [Clostridium sp. CT7]